jgi:hypothetical protein
MLILLYSFYYKIKYLLNKNKYIKQMKHTRRYNKKNRKHYYLGGTSFYQKGVAAQLRSSMPHNSVLRRKLNEIVHSGDFYESKERNSFLDLNNNDDAEAQKVLSEAIDYIKDHLSSKIKERVLQGIVPVTASTTSGYKTSTKRMRTQNPTKTNRINTVTNTVFRNRSRMRTRKMYKK